MQPLTLMLPPYSCLLVGFCYTWKRHLTCAIGVAIYFYSPLWTFSVMTQVALDGSPVLLDLRDYSQLLDINGPETVQSSIVWSQTSLVDMQHTLLVSVGAGQTIAILDTLVYVLLSAFSNIHNKNNSRYTTNNIPSSSSTSASTSSISTL